MKYYFGIISTNFLHEKFEKIWLILPLKVKISMWNFKSQIYGGYKSNS